MIEFVYKKLTEEQKEKFNTITNEVIDFLRSEKKLEIWECYFIIKALFESFPIEDLTVSPKESRESENR